MADASAGRLSEGQPRHGCASLTNQEEVQGSFVILERGECMFAAKVGWGVISPPENFLHLYPLRILPSLVDIMPQRLCCSIAFVDLPAWYAQVMAAEGAGAAAAIIINTEDRLMPMGDDAEHKPTIPSIHLPLSAGQALRNALTASSGSLRAMLRPSRVPLDSPDASAPAACAAESPVVEVQKELSNTDEMTHAAGSQACHDSREGLQGQGWCAAGQIEPAQPSDGGVEDREDGACELSNSGVQMPDDPRGQRQVMTAPASSAQKEAEFQAAEAELQGFSDRKPGRPGPHRWLRLCMLSKAFVPCFYLDVCQLHLTTCMCTDDSKEPDGHPDAAGRERLADGHQAKVVSCNFC